MVVAFYFLLEMRFAPLILGSLPSAKWKSKSITGVMGGGGFLDDSDEVNSSLLFRTFVDG